MSPKKMRQGAVLLSGGRGLQGKGIANAKALRSELGVFEGPVWWELSYG